MPPAATCATRTPCKQWHGDACARMVRHAAGWCPVDVNLAQELSQAKRRMVTSVYLQAGLWRHNIVARALLVWLPCRLLILIAAKRPGLCMLDEACVSMLCTSLLARSAAHRLRSMLAFELAGMDRPATHLARVIQCQSVPAAERSLPCTRKSWNATLLNA
jgi:hypothetical protein